MERNSQQNSQHSTLTTTPILGARKSPFFLQVCPSLVDPTTPIPQLSQTLTTRLTTPIAIIRTHPQMQLTIRLTRVITTKRYEGPGPWRFAEEVRTLDEEQLLGSAAKPSLLPESTFAHAVIR